MTDNIILMDSVVYNIIKLKDELHEFEPIVLEHVEYIFGDGYRYVPKRKLKTLANNRSIPDGFVIDFENKKKWYILELKLLCDDAINRISRQIVNYKNAVKNLTTKKEIYDAINDTSLYKLIFDKSPEIVIIIDNLDGEKGAQFREQVEGTDKTVKIIEFKTYAREHVEPDKVHLHIFSPLVNHTAYKKPTATEKISGEKPIDISLQRPVQESVDVFKIPIKSITPLKYNLIYIHKKNRHFFPGYKVPFILGTDIGEIEARIVSAHADTEVGNPNAGCYIKNVKPNILKKWYKKHSDLGVGDNLLFEIIEPKKIYKLSNEGLSLQ